MPHDLDEAPFDLLEVLIDAWNTWATTGRARTTPSEVTSALLIFAADRLITMAALSGEPWPATRRRLMAAFVAALDQLHPEPPGGPGGGHP